MRRACGWALTAALVSLLTTCGDTASAAQPKVELKLGHIQSSSSPLHKAVEYFAKRVSEKTNGTVTINLFPNSQLGKQDSQVFMVKSGQLDMFIESPTAYTNLVKDFNILTVPFAIKNQSQLIKIIEDKGIGLQDRLMKSGVRTIAYNWPKAPRNIISKQPIHTLNDLASVKLRVPAIQAFIQSWQALGAKTQPLDLVEVYLGLQQGLIQAADNPITDLVALKWHEQAKYLIKIDYYPATNLLIMNNDSFSKLSPEEQKALVEAAHEAGDYEAGLLGSATKTALDEMAKAGVQVIVPNDLRGWQEKSASIPAQLEAKGLWEPGLWAKVQAVK